jgi:hypothetical protein
MEHTPQQSTEQQTQQERPEGVETERVDPEWDLLMGFLPEGWRGQAKALGALQRVRKVKTPEALMRLGLMHAGVGLSLQRTAQMADQMGMARMSKVAVQKRLRGSGDWVGWIVGEMLQVRVEVPAVWGYRLRAVDGSSVVGPAGGVQLRLHYSIGLPDLRCEGVDITDEHGAEGLEHFTVSEGDLLIGDRIYAKANGIAHVKRVGGDVIVRLGCTSLILHDKRGRKIDRLAWLRKTRVGRPIERFAQFRDPEKGWVTGRMCAIRLSKAQAAKARERCEKKARRKRGGQPKESTLEAAGFFCVFTTVPADDLSAHVLLELYRARWQIELAFKRLKSLLEADQLRDTSLESARVWLQFKMLYALLLNAYLDEAGAFFPWGYPLLDRDRTDRTPTPSHGDLCLGAHPTRCPRPQTCHSGDHPLQSPGVVAPQHPAHARAAPRGPNPSTGLAVLDTR